ncbi:MAG TPA: hypothetical protein VG295_02510 [Solirubrobacteraceae bacterium]|nr:hypothetical protein [Solirubrobacteraceae bacterium]
MDPAGEELAQLAAMVPFAAKLGISLLAARPDEVVGRLDFSPELCTVGGVAAARGEHGDRVETEIRDGEGRLLAQVVQAQAVIGR